jgi:hypothetical protein
VVGVEAHRLEEIADHGLESLRSEVDQVRAVIECGKDLLLLDESGVVDIELEDRRYRRKLGRGWREVGPEPLQGSLRVELGMGQVQAEECLAIDPH